MNMNKEKISVILGKVPSKVDMGMGNHEEKKAQYKSEEMEILAQDLIDAIESKDAKAVANSFEALVSCCQEEEEAEEE